MRAPGGGGDKCSGSLGRLVGAGVVNPGTDMLKSTEKDRFLVCSGQSFMNH